MRPVYLTALSAVGATAPVPVNWRAGQFNVGLYGILSSGASLTWTAQFTSDDITAPGYDPSAGNWIDSSLATETTSGAASLTIPATAVRFAVSVHSSGTLTPVVIQSGSGGD